MNYVIPKVGLDALDRLAAYLAPFGHVFRRRWSRERLERSITGVLTELPHTTCDIIAAAIAGTSAERLHHVLTAADWMFMSWISAELNDRLP